MRRRSDRFPLGARVTIDDLAVEPYPVFDRLRVAEPVTWVPELKMWMVTRRDDVLRVLGDWERFTTDSPASTIKDIFGSHMLTTDGETQIATKRRFIGPFRRGNLEQALLGPVNDVLAELMEGLDSGTSAELRSRIAGPLSIRSVCRVLGLPESDAPRLAAWYDAFAAALANFTRDPAVRATGKQAAAEFSDYVGPFLDGARPVEPDSMIGSLIADPDPLGATEMTANLLIVLFGGIETTEAMISNALWAALVHPGVVAVVAQDPSRLDGLIEESLRWDSAVQSCTRFTTEPVVIRGVEIPQGETVQCMLGAANRDPDHFPDPGVFDLDRENARDHLAFGAGRHFCLGASLARIEAEQALARIFEALPGLRLDDGRLAPPYGHEFRKPPTVWVVWD